jgi:hypothetical protein
MPVYLHLANLIVDKSAVVRKYAGGVEQFRLDYKIGGENYNKEDDELFTIARMNIDEFDIERLTARGLHYEEEPEFSPDFVLKYRYAKTMWEAPWLEYTIIFAWHINAKPEQIARALEIGEMTFDDIEEHRKRGVELFSAIRGF